MKSRVPSPTASAQAAFTGQSITLTAPTIGTATPSRYQWQERSGSRWTSLGTASASATKSVSSTTRRVRVFRVVITYASGPPANSGTISISWRPITVVAASSPDDPQSGAASKRTVTLTATADAPTGATYQWQYWNAGSWTDIGSASTSNTKSVSSTTRGTWKYRVEVSHTTALTVQSDPIYVTWDEWAIVSDMLSALQTAVTADARYTTAQTALLTCMNRGSSGGASGAGGFGNATSTPPVSGASTAPAPRFTSFDDILSQYTGTTKIKMETGGSCASQATTMFNTVQTLSRSKLAALKAGNTAYAALLETPHGRQFETKIGAPYIVKQFAYLLANQPQDSSGASGASGSSTGFECLPSNGQAPATLQGKLDVLNCLVFDTPHSFWVNRANELKRRIDNAHTWLGYGDWECTASPDGPVPSCKKHDVAFGSLQIFAGQAGVDEQGIELDEAWNPRNKALADAKFFTDISTHGCQNQSFIASRTVCQLSKWALAKLYHYFVAHMNNKGWPVTQSDIRHTTNLPRFVRCDDVPKITAVTATQLTSWSVRVTWTYEGSNCIPDITVDHFSVCATGFHDDIQESFRYQCSSRVSGTARSTDLSPTYNIPFEPGTMEVRFLIGIIPNDIDYGSAGYPPYHFDISVRFR